MKSNEETKRASGSPRIRLLDDANSQTTVLDRLAEGDARASLTFAGQGIGYFDEIVSLHAESASAATLIDAAAETLEEMVQRNEFVWSGLYSRGFDLARWIQDEDVRPDLRYLSSAPISMPLIFTAQLARYVALYERGLDRAFAAGTVASSTGHSQGIMAAVLVAESPNGAVKTTRFVEHVRFLMWQGLHMANSHRALVPSDPPLDPSSTAMAAVGRLDIDTLLDVAQRVNKTLPAEAHLSVSLRNTRTRNVASGPPRTMERLHEALTAIGDKEKSLKKEGRFAGRPTTFTWEYLPVGAGFHSQLMKGGVDAMRESMAKIGFKADASALAFDVFAPDGENRMNDSKDLLEHLIQSQFVDPVCWQKTLLNVAEDESLTHVFDFGPGDGVARLSMASLRGTGLPVIPLSTASGRQSALEEPADAITIPVDYRAFAPRLAKLPGGKLVIDNRYTRATGQSPVILPGMTPTTVDAPIVAAAANAGHTSELAGGGQVTEAMFRTRMAELEELLEPGCEVVFNGLFLDPYLWDLHVRRTGIVQELKREGAPISGVTISAGIPEIDEATRLLDEFAEIGLWLNAFKPGSTPQVKQVCKIARANSQHTVFVHLEGGKAGGHHSWENLDELLIDTYHLLRAEPNVVLCVGGGISTEARGVALLDGSWSSRYGLPSMPVDAIFLGTPCMAAKEATATKSVKDALAKAAGCDEWVFAGDIDGDVTSGKSQLNADIHYLDNSASRTGRLLDTVAGDEETVEARRDEIIEALNRTCKPYFGDLEEMTYLSVLERMVALMAVGESTPYEDGIWPDASYRQRVADFIRRTEGRLSPIEEGTVESILGDLDELDAPSKVLKRLAKSFPSASTTTLHAMDVRHFIYSICARPGKPVNFVPVVNADVRRWFKSDSLWQAQNSHYTADQVLVIPGPEAVKGIQSKNEPVANILQRHVDALISSLQTQGESVREIEGLWDLDSSGAFGLGLRVEEDNNTTTVTVEALNVEDAWFDAVRCRYSGPIAALMGAPRIFEGRRSLKNPVHALMMTKAGSSLTIEHEDERIGTLIYRTNEGESVTLTADESGTVNVVVTPQLVSAGNKSPAQYTFALQHKTDGAAEHFAADPEDQITQLQRFYQEALFGSPLEGTKLFESASMATTVSAKMVQGYAAVTGGAAFGTSMPLNMGFSLAWEPIFRALSAPELAGGMLRLVHLSNRFESGIAWPLKAEDEVQVSARVTRLENGARGRTIRTLATIKRGDKMALQVESAFFVRDSFGHTDYASQAVESETRTLAVPDRATALWLNDHALIKRASGFSFEAGQTLEAELVLKESIHRIDGPLHEAEGTLSLDGQGIADITGTASTEDHPGRQLLEALKAPAAATVDVTRRTLAHRDDHAPTAMNAFAEVGRDRNPIHTSTLMAQMAGLDGCIVHGMWTSARAHAFLVEDVLGNAADRVKSFEAEFLSPALPGEAIALSAVLSGTRGGDLQIEVTVEANRPDGTAPLMRAKATVKSPRTAYVFPGQGIQQKGMGMDGYARSAAARTVWDQADTFTRENIGFSILQIVKENPQEVIVGGATHVHDKGVLNLTQFTQVAMAVLSQAQVAEMREAGILNDEAIVCGHSVGEYNAVGSLGDVLPLTTIIQTVYERGMAMHSLVPRNAAGESGYRMGVIRPHYAGMDEDDAKTLAAKIAAELGLALEIVNYNIRGRQYSVVGHVPAIEALKETLAERVPDGGKAAYIEVPGIDVPFHSGELAQGVAPFRATLEARFDDDLAVNDLIGRYIPNLVPRPFTLDKAYVQEVADYTGSEPLKEALNDWKQWSADPQALGRRLLIELFCWQFASPVRWIETQDLLLLPESMGGMGVEQIIEIGVGYQPTLANMAKYSMQLLGGAAERTEVLNVEVDGDDVFHRIGDPEENEDPAPDASEATPAPTTAEAPAAAPAPAPAAAPANAGPLEDTPVPPSEALKAILAIQSRVRAEQISDGETIDELFEGVSSRRNQVLLDIGAEFNLGTIDGAHEQPLAELTAEIVKRCTTYKTSGKYLRAVQDEAIKRVFGRSGMGRKDLLSYLDTHFGMGAQLADAVITLAALETREGDSARGGALSSLGSDAPANKGAAGELLDKAAAQLGSLRGIGVAKRGGASAGGAGAAVDAAVVDELAEKIIGPEGALMKVARDLAEHLGQSLVPGKGLPTVDESAERLDAMLAEHGAGYEELIVPQFDVKKHVAFTSEWAWNQRGVAKLAFEGSQGRMSDEEMAAATQQLSNRPTDRTRSTASWYAAWAAKRGAKNVASLLTKIARSEGPTALHWIPTRPHLEITSAGDALYEEKPATGKIPRTSFVKGLQLTNKEPFVKVGDASEFNADFEKILLDAVEGGIDFAGRTAVVTGAGPNSIALAVVAHLLHGGARVVVTTSSYRKERIRYYRRFYQDHAAPGAELHVVPFNQTSLQDVENFAAWLFATITEQSGAEVKVVKRPFAPDIVLPFAAIKDLATMDTMGARSQAALRTMLLSVETLIGAIATEYNQRGLPEMPCHVVLPLSPNHGAFGGDGAYAETKAALEVMANKWHSEHDAWGRATTLCTARIGWVRGTGLMDANNPVAAALEEQTGVKTFATSEMSLLLTALCSDTARLAARTAPLAADLTGGFSEIEDLRGTVDGIRQRIEDGVATARKLTALRSLDAANADEMPSAIALPNWPRATFQSTDIDDTPASNGVALEDMVVVVGAGEIGPCGNSRTRLELEIGDELSAAAVLELSWMCGLVRYDDNGRGGVWVDTETDEEVAENAIAEKYRERLD